MQKSLSFSTLLFSFFLFTLSGVFAYAQSWTLASPLYTGTPYAISVGGLSTSTGSVTIFAQAPGSSTWTGCGGGGGAPGSSQVTASGTIGFSVAGTWTIKVVDGTSSSSSTLSQITRTVTNSVTSTTFTFSNLTHTYDGTAKTAGVTPTPSNATYTSDLTKGPGAGSYTVSASANGSFSGSGSNTLVINPAGASFALNNTSFGYTGTAQGPSVVASPANATFSTGGTLSAVDAGTYTATASANGNYTGSNGSLTWTINKANQATLTLNASTTQLYNAGQTLSVSGGSGGGGVGYAIVNQSAAGVATLTGATLTANTGAGWVDIQASKAADTNYNVTSSTPVRVTFGKATATVTLGNLSQNYDGSPKSATAVTSPAGLPVGFTYDGSGAAPSAVGSYAVVGTINHANYAGSASGTLAITKTNQAALTLVANTSQTYNNVQTLGSSGGSGSGTVTYAITNQSSAGVATLAGATLTANASAGWVDVQATKAGDANFNSASSAAVRVTFSKAAASVTLGNLAQTYNGSPKAATATTSPAGLSVTFTYDGSGTAPTNAGSYAVIGTITDANYSGSASGTLVIAKANQTALTLAANTTQAYNSQQTLSSSGGSGSGAVSYEIVAQSTGGVATLAGATLTANAASGWVDVRASKAADTNYNSATSGTVRVTLGKATATVTLGSLSQTYSGTARSATAITSPAALPVTFTYNGSGTAPTGPGSYIVVGTINHANYAGSATGTLTVSKAALTITATNLSKVFGTSNPSLTVSYSGFVNGETSSVVSNLTVATAATTGSSVGAYAITPSGATAANYTINHVPGTLTVSAQAVSFTFSNLAFTYDGTQKAPLVNNPSGATFSTTGTSSATNTGSYTFTVTATGNYSGTGTCNWSIGSAIASVTLGNLGHTYNGSQKTATATTVPAGLPVIFTYAGSSTPPTNAGSYAVVATVNDPSFNYSGSATGTLVIGKATQASISLIRTNPQVYATQQTLSITGGSGTGAVSYTIEAQSSAGVASRAGAVLTALSGTGWVDVKASKAADNNYLIRYSGTMRINLAKAPATVLLGALNPTYNGSPLAVSASTTPAGLPVVLTYDGASTAPTAAGSYAVVGSINSPNYTGSANGTLIIGKANQAALTLNATTSQVFGTSQTLSSTGGTGTGTISFAISGQSAVGAGTLSGDALTSNTGSGWVDATATRAGGANYNPVTSSAVRINFVKASAPIALNGLQQTYSGAPRVVTATTTPGGLGVAVTYAGSATAPSDIGSYAVQATVTDLNYTGSASGSLVISPVAQTVTVSPMSPSIEYGQSVTLTASGGQTGYIWGGAASGTGSSVMLTPNAGIHTVTVHSPAATNYAQSNTATVQVNVTKAVPAGTFSGKTVNGPYTFVEADKSATFVHSNTGVAAPATVVYSIPAGTVLNAGTHIITATHPGDANYVSASVSATFTVNKSTPTVSWSPANIKYGEPYGPTQLNALASVAGTFEYNPTASTPAAPLGTKTLSAIFSPTDTANHNPTTASATVTVSRASQAITFPAAGTKTYGDAPFSLAARASSGLPVSYSVTPSNLATISNNAIMTILGAGTITVTASQAGDSYYEAAAPVLQTITVNKANQTITFPDPGASHYALRATSSSGLPVRYTSSDTNVGVIDSYPAVDPNVPPTSMVVFIGNFSGQSVIVTAHQDGNDNYHPAQSVASPTLYTGTDDQWLTRPPSSLTLGPSTSFYNLRFSSVFGMSTRMEYRLGSGAWQNCGAGGGSPTGRHLSSGGVSFSSAGTYTIRVMRRNFPNDPEVEVNGATLEINVVNGQTITFPSIGVRGVGSNVSLGATSTSGLAVTYSVISGQATVAGSTLSISAKGPITVKASQAGSSQYAPAVDVFQTFLAVEPPRLNVDSVVSPPEPMGNLTGSGYALDPEDGAPITVQLVIDGIVTPASVLTNGLSRPEVQANSVANGWSSKNVTNSGWSFSYNVGVLAYGNHSYYIRAINSQGVQTVSPTYSFTGGSNQRPQVIIFPIIPDKTLGSPSFQLSATASSGLPVTYTVVSGPATVSGSTVTLGTTVGTVTIRASQAGSTAMNYAPAPDVERTFGLGVSTGGTQNPLKLFSHVDLSVIGKGTGTVALTVDGKTYNFKFQPLAGQEWSEPRYETGYELKVWHSAEIGANYSVQATSTGLTDFIVKAKVPAYINPGMNIRAECGGSYAEAITKAELQANAFNLRVVPVSILPFAEIDMSKFEVQNLIRFGLGASRGNESAGMFTWTGGASIFLIKGPAAIETKESGPRVQIKVPSGYADLVRGETLSMLSYYPDGTYALNGQLYDFTGTTPLATYTVSVANGAGTLTRAAAGVMQVLEWQSSSASSESEHTTTVYTGPGGGFVESWQEIITDTTLYWPWRASTAVRGGVTQKTVSRDRTVVTYPTTGPTYQYQPVKVKISRHLGASVSAALASYEVHDFAPNDTTFMSETAVTYGYGSDSHSGGSRTAQASSFSISPMATLNGLGGGTVTEYYSPSTGAAGSANFGTQPFIALGEPRSVRKSYLDNTINSATDVVTTYTYLPDLVDGKAAPSGSTTAQGSTNMGSTTFNYATGTLNGLTTITTTAAKQAAASTTLTTVSRNYSRRLSDIDLREKPVSVTNPDNTKVSFAYQRGTLSGSTWTAGASGPDLLTATLNGKSGSTLNSYLGVSIDSLDMDPNRSVVVERITNRDGRVIRETSHVYTGGSSFAQLNSVYYAYNRLGDLIMKADQPIGVDAVDNPSTAGRVLYEAAYSGWRKMSEEDEQGVTRTYEYDNYDRVWKMTRTSASALETTISATTTTYEYDLVGRLRFETLSGGSETALVTSHEYDTANRPIKKTEPGSLITTVVYNSPVSTTLTVPGGGTKTEVRFADGRMKSVDGSAVTDVATSYAIDSSGNEVTTETAGGTKTTTSVKDWMGRTLNVNNATYSGGTRSAIYSYNSLGQLWRKETKSGATSLTPPRLYSYDAYGRLQKEALDSSGNGEIDPSLDLDVKEYEFAYQQGAPGHATIDWYRYVGQKIWPYDGIKAGSSRYASQAYVQQTGLGANLVSHGVSLDFDRNKTDSSTTVDRASKLLTVTTTASGTSQTIQAVSLNGLPIRTNNAQGHLTKMTYDALGRLKTSIDPRIGTTTLDYWPGGFFVKVSTPADGRATSFDYDSGGRVKLQTTSAGTAYSQYDGAGNLTHQWGDTTNPVRYEYNDFGQKIKMHTYRSGTWTGSGLPAGFDAGGDVTTWNYQGSTGLLTSKVDASARTFSYEYNALDQISKRTDARAWITNYTYTSSNLLWTVDYTDGLTTDIVREYDRTGKLSAVTDAAGRRTFGYYETWTDDTYANELRNKSVRLKTETLPSAFFGSSSNVLNHDYQYQVANRTNGAEASVRIGDGTTYQVAYGYDDTLRLNSVSYNGGTAFTYTYVGNSNLIDTVSRSGGYLRDYDYRATSNRLETLKHSWSGGSAMETRLDYNLPGLRSTEKTQGNAWMAALGRSAETGVHTDYTYTARSEVDSSGKYLLGVDWSVGAFKGGTARDYEYDPIGNRNSTYGYTANELNQYTAAPALGVFSYDNNGNMTGDGVRTYTYDGENRLISLAQGGSTWSFVYDYLGRRIQKSGTALTTTKYLYDGWNLIAELDASGNVLRKFAWGLDVSGTLQGAGGVGGLLQIDAGSSYYPVYDGSHNVVALYNSSGGMAAAYEYDPFGNLQTAAGSYAAVNPFRSATKFMDVESGLVYYGMRYYHPALGRFINADPIEEQGGINLYGFCGNDGVNRWDYLGLTDDEVHKLPTFTETVPDTAGGEIMDQYAWSNTLQELNEASRSFAQGTHDYIKQVHSNMSFFSYGILKGIADIPASAVQLAKLMAQLQDRGVQAQIAVLVKRFAEDPEFRAAVKAHLKKEFGVVIDDLSTQEGFMAALGRLGGQIIGTKGLAELAATLSSLETTTARLEGHMRSAIARVEVEGLTAAQQRALIKNPGLEAAYRGDRIDTLFKDAVRLDPKLQHLEITPRYKFGPDVFDPATQKWWDVTTPAQWQPHVEKYWLFGEGTPLLTR